MKTLDQLTVGELRKKLANSHKNEGSTVDAIYALSEHGNERFSEICARLGSEHKIVQKYEQESERARILELECRRRYGQAVPYRNMWDTLLAHQMRRK